MMRRRLVLVPTIAFMTAVAGCSAADPVPDPPAPSEVWASQDCDSVEFRHDAEPSDVPVDAERVLICYDWDSGGDELDEYEGVPLQVRVDHLVEYVRSQPPYSPPAEDEECPTDDGPQYVLVFQSPDGQEARIWARVSGCGGTLGRDASWEIFTWLAGDVERSDLP